MFEQEKSAPLYKSRPVFIGLCGVAGLVIVAGILLFLRSRSDSNDEHYAELEQHRQQQAAQAPAAAPAATASPVATASPGASPSETTAAPAAGPARNYWTNFRGPKRDGNYEATQVLTSWPSGGLSPVWKQPIGVGYASFAVADGRAYTIEQRRGQEVGAA